MADKIYEGFSVELTLDVCFFVFKHKTAYDMRIRDYSSDVCSSDLRQSAHRIERKIMAVQRFGRDNLEPGMVQHLAQHIVANLALRRNRAAHIVRKPCPGLHPVVDQRISGAGVKGQQNGKASCRERVWQYV